MPPKAVKRGKENAPPPKSKTQKIEIAEDDVDDFDAMLDDDPELVKPAKVTKPSRTVSATKSKPAVEDGMDNESRTPVPSGDAAKQLASITAERDRFRTERDTFAKQFEDLARLRSTSAETLLEKYKEKATARAKTQDELIANLTLLNERQAAKVAELEKALAASQAAAEQASERAAVASAQPSLGSKLDGKGIKELRDEVYKLRKVVNDKDEQITTLKTDLENEVEYSRKLQKDRAPSAVPAAVAPASSEESLKDSLSLKLYEDATGLAILRVKPRTTQSSGQEVSYSCVQTLEDKRFAFKLRTYNELDRASKKWLKQLELVPEGLQYEDKELVRRLGPFAEGFTIPREQLKDAWDQLRERLSPYGEYNEPAVAA